MVKTQWLQCGQTLPFSAKGVACKTSKDPGNQAEAGWFGNEKFSMLNSGSRLYLERTWDDIACKAQHCLDLGGELWILHHHLLVPVGKLPQYGERADSSRGEIGASISKLWGSHLGSHLRGAFVG